MKNIILIDNEPYTRRREQLFYINRLIKDGFNVEIWDLSSLFPRGKNMADKIESKIVKRFYSVKEVSNKLKTTNINETFFIVEIDKNNYSYRIYKELQKRKCVIARFNFFSNIIPTYHIDLSLYKFGSFVFFKKAFTKINNYLKWRYYQIKWIGIKYDYYLSPCNENMVTSHINHPDYNDFKFKAETPCLDVPYLVFCDNYFPLHPDLKGIADHLSAEKYQRLLTKFFDYIEQVTTLPVVIAAHPKAEYKGSEFGDRKIFKYQTNNLVCNSKGVILHTSNSISYALLANKNIMCITTDDYNSVEYLSLKLIANCTYLRLPLYNIEHEEYDMIQFNKVEADIRHQYIYSFLTSKETENKDNYDIIKATISKAKYPY